MDKYDKNRQIGEGSFGKAFLVTCKTTNNLYVMKEINISKMSPSEIKEARREVEVLSQMNHINIVSYRESFEEFGYLIIIMDYCEGGDLYTRINGQRGIAFSEEQILDWFVQLCLALKHVHDQKILHRDIKSQNIFLTKDGIIKLGDFGIARVLNSTTDLARTCIGTPYYLSPEICENNPYNNKSDIWSLGCVLYELTTLRHAFEAGNMKNLVLKIIRGSYPPVPSRYSYDLRNLISQLFKRNPKDRPSIISILNKPFIKKRAVKFSNVSSFSHESNNKQSDTPKNTNKNGISKPAAKYGISLAKRRQSVIEEKKHKAAYISHKASELALLKKNILAKQRMKERLGVRIEKNNARLERKNIEDNQVTHDAVQREVGNYDYYNFLLDNIGFLHRKCEIYNTKVKNYLKEPVDLIQIRNKAMLAEEFFKRKQQAEINKAKVAYDLGICITPFPERAMSPDNVSQVHDNKKNEEEYLSRLKAIRIQNMYEQQAIREKIAADCKKVNVDLGAKGDCNPYISSEINKHKMDVLRCQSEMRATRIKAKIEERRKEAYEREKQQWKEHLEIKGLRKVYNEINMNSSKNCILQNTKETNKCEELHNNIKRERSHWQPVVCIPLNEYPLEQTRSEMEETGVNDIVITNPSQNIISGSVLSTHQKDPEVKELPSIIVSNTTVTLNSDVITNHKNISEDFSLILESTAQNQNNYTNNKESSLENNAVSLDVKSYDLINENEIQDNEEKDGHLAVSCSNTNDITDSHTTCFIANNVTEKNENEVKVKKDDELNRDSKNHGESLLRTCSLPDLTKLMLNCSFDLIPTEAIAKKDWNDEISDLSPENEEDDMATLRRSMASILESNRDVSDEVASDELFSDTSGSITPHEDWHSDSSEEECINGTNTNDKFIRLEECRVQLEEELGLKKFVKAYQAIQAIHEDEDDSMKEGIFIINGILGKEQEYLYPKILQLVMADGTFAEDNESDC